MGQATGTILSDRLWGWKLVAAAGLVFAGIRILWAASAGDWTGADAFYYVAQARSLAEGRGFVVDYVRWHFSPYPSVFGRPEDFFHPLFPLSLVPGIRLLGDTYLAYTLSPILTTTLGLPLVAYGIARRVGLTRRESALAGLLSLVHPALALEGQTPMSDPLFALFGSLSFLALLHADGRVRRGALAGTLAGLAYLTRGQGQLLVLIYPLLIAWRRRSLRALLAPDALAFVACAVVTEMPWLIRNTLLFGSPTYSIYQLIGPYFGWADRSSLEMYGLHWGRATPTLLDRYSQPGAAGFIIFFRWVPIGLEMIFGGILKTFTERGWEGGLVAQNYHLWNAALGVPALFELVRRRRTFEAQSVLALSLALAAAVAAVNCPSFPRYFRLMTPVVACYGVLAIREVGVRCARWIPVAWMALLFTTAIIAILVRMPVAHVPLDPFARTNQLAAVEAARWISRNTPASAIVLTEAGCGMAQYYAHRPTVAAPRAPLGDQLAVARHYNTRYAIAREGKPLAAAGSVLASFGLYRVLALSP